jgi:hypothetical protein
VVLEYLRTGEVFVPAGVTPKQIEYEFEFYQISWERSTEDLDTQTKDLPKGKQISAVLE